MNEPRALEVPALCWRCDPNQFAFETTADVPDLEALLGQARALDAVRFGIAIRREGYNLYVLGPPGIGKRTVVRQCLEQTATQESTPPDWCYLNNFDDIRRPRAIALPAGRGVKLRADVKELIEELGTTIPAALEGDEHKGRVQEIEREEAQRQNGAFEGLSQKALTQKIQLIRTPGGFALAPLRDAEVLSPDAYQQLPEDQRRSIQETVAGLQSELQSIVEQVPKWHKEARDKVKKLNRDAVQLAIGHLLSQLKQKYTDLPQVLAYLEAVEKDIIEHVDEFQPADEPPVPIFGGSPQPTESFDNYEVNLLVDNSSTRGAPIVYEDHPSYQNLIGRVEHESHMGALLTDFTLIKGGRCNARTAAI